MKSRIAIFSLIIGLSLMVCKVSGEELTDSDIWSFCLYLYGFDAEERERLEGIGEEYRTHMIQSFRDLNKSANLDGSQIRVRNPEDFSPEEREFWDMMRDSMKVAKHESAAAIERAESITDTDRERIIILCEEIWEKMDLGELRPFEFIFPNDNGFSDEWEFLVPVRIDVSAAKIDVWIYRNPLANQGPQVMFTVTKGINDDNRNLKYSDNIGTTRDWTIQLPVYRRTEQR